MKHFDAIQITCTRIITAGAESTKDRENALSKAVNIVCKPPFLMEKKIFSILLFDEVSEKFAPAHFARLLEVIPEGRSQSRERAKSTKKIDINIAQLIKFNAVKTVRETTTLVSRPTKQNEPTFSKFIELLIHINTRRKNVAQLSAVRLGDRDTRSNHLAAVFSV